MRMSSSPARTASSTTYWIAGLSTTGSISFGVAFVAGKNRVPRPAAGTTAFWTALAVTAMGKTLQCRSPVHEKKALRARLLAARSDISEAERDTAGRALRDH